MRILIAGIDGYLGWTLAQYLAKKGHEIYGVDNLIRREWVSEMGGISAIEIERPSTRHKAFAEVYDQGLIFFQGDITDYDFLWLVVRDIQPHVIVHLAENPSAPYSMIGARTAAQVQTNNIVGTLNILHAIRLLAPEAHLVKLGTMGEYGTPNVDIPEGFFEIEYRGRKDRLPFPRQAGSWYHLSKVHDSHNIHFACNNWGLSATDIMQGVVFGTSAGIEQMDAEPRLATRLDFDQAFGTLVNRFCCQAVIGQPLTVYGSGNQRRGFLPLRDSMQCLGLVIENPPEPGEYRVLNQFMQVFSVKELAEMVARCGEQIGLKVAIGRVPNPRNEQEEHYYNPDHQGLFDLGYRPTVDIEAEIGRMLIDLMDHKKRIEARQSALLPTIKWK